MLAVLPELLFDSDGAILPSDPRYQSGDHNSENTALYAVHPFRQFGMGKPDLDKAQETYRKRPHKCNNGGGRRPIVVVELGVVDVVMPIPNDRLDKTAL